MNDKLKKEIIEREKYIKCGVCGSPAMKNSVICSDRCAKIRLKMFELDKKYFPTHGCENCWGDLGKGCTEQCRREFRESKEFGQDLWSLVRLFFEDNLSLIQQEVPKGVCKHCWNKGYSTEMTEVVSSADFFGDKEYKTGAKIKINFCKCDKGKQLKELIQREREELLGEIEKRIPSSENVKSINPSYFRDIIKTLKSNLKK